MARTNIRPQRPEQVTAQEAADYIGVHYSTMLRWISEGHIKAVRMGPRILKINVADLDSVFQPVGGDVK